MSDGLRIVRYHPRAAVGDGGMTGAIARWSAALAAAGAHMTIAYADGQATAEHGQVIWRRVRHAGPALVRIPLGLERVVEGADLLVLHSGWTAHNARAAAVARSLGVPYLLEPRGAYDPHIVRRHAGRKRAWWTIAERAVVDGALAIHAFFDEERSHLDAIGYRGPIVVASNGVETPQPVSWTGGGGYLLFLGRFDPEHKGLDLLVEAVAGLPSGQRPTIRLHGPDWRGGKAATARLIARHGLQGCLRIGPAVYGDDKRRLLAAAEGFVYPSRWDACPNAVLEAVAMGMPSLVTPYPLGTYLGDREGAVLADASVEGLLEGLRRLADRAAMARIGATGRAVAESDFRWASVAERWLEQAVGCLGRSSDAGSTLPVPSPIPGAARR